MKASLKAPKEKLRFWKLAVALLVGSVALGWACGRPQVPPGPPPEYERPRVQPWDAGPVEDPFAHIEAEGEWVGEAESGRGGAPPQAPASPAPGRPQKAQ